MVSEQAVLKKRNLPKVSGFTTIELLVAMVLFVVLLSIAASGFINSLRTERSIVSLINANNNASLVLEQIAREMRTGYKFQLVSSNEIQFLDAREQTIHYRLNAGAIQRGVDSGSGISYESLTSGTVKITNFSIVFCPDPQNPNQPQCSLTGDFPPRITIGMSVSTTNKSLEGISTNIQTTISPRNI